MTARRGLKKIVRGRMARTGETYSTALRAVARPTIRHRESALVGFLLEDAGLHLSEPMVCGLGGGIGFMYAVFEYDAVPHPLLTLIMQHHPQPWAAAVFDRLRLPYEEGHSASTKTARAALLAQERPVLCTVDRRLLPWRDTPDMAAADPHTVVVAARAGETLTILDPPYGEKALGVEEFTAAWASHKKGRFHRVTLPAVSDVDLDAAVRDAVSGTIAHLTGPVLGNGFDVNFGFSGMAKLAGELRDARTRKGWTRRFAEPAGRAHAMRRLVECLEREYTAPGGTRPIYADFLEQALPDQREAATLIRRAGACWSALARSATADGDLRAWCDRAADLVDEAATLEKRAVETLSATVDGR
jgi:Domain of unknown function (DUF4872)/Butirosin biosynthesis protein H, N-terminal